MNWKQKVREPKILSLALILGTLAVGILIGTLIHTEVRADKGSDKPVTDATPLKIPSPVKLQNEFTAIVNKVEPAVVNISTEYKPKQETTRQRVRPPQSQEGEEDEEGMDLFRRFFRQGPLGESPSTQPRGGGEGSGFIVDPKGYIITNHHVVDDATTIKVKLHGDPAEHRAKLIGFDVETDLAVIKIEAPRTLPFVPVGNSDAVQVGDWAIAIGSPFGLEASVTVGIVSAQGRDVAQQFQKFIQTDAAINPGNSGGPLLNIRGEVIGVNTAIATRSGGNQGIGFALPVNMAVKVYNQLTRYGRVTRGSIGISWTRGQERPELLKALGVSNGVIVEQVTKDGPADKAGVKPEDIIVAMNGKSVKDGEDLVARVADTPIGENITVTLDRKGKKMDVPITVRDRAEVFKDDPRFARIRPPVEEEPGEAAEAKFGLYVKGLTPSEREQIKDSDGAGVRVTQVIEGSFAEEIGVQVGDTILSINRKPVASVEDIRKIQGTLKPGDPVAFRIARANPLSRRGGAPEFTVFFLAGTLPKE
ncbi:MAG: Do family serine endopeptidase [Bryobacterales bacterium]|nr:Do family serine endopeptidase [Bryobacterales bacterium]